MSEKVTAMIEEIKGLTVLELSELVHALEEEFGVSAAAMAAPAAGAAAPAAEEKTDFDVVLTGFDAAQKIKVIKVIREVMGLGLAEAKAAVEGAPTTMKEGLSKEDAEALKKQVEEVGGKVELKSVILHMEKSVPHGTLFFCRLAPVWPELHGASARRSTDEIFSTLTIQRYATLGRVFMWRDD